MVPGVSATILAIVMGFYEELLGAINRFGENRRGNAAYLGAFLLGVCVGAVAFSWAAVFLLARFPIPVMLFFTGLLAGSVPLVASKAAGRPPRFAAGELALAAVFAAALVALSLGAGAATVEPGYAFGSMTLPLVLLVLLAGIINGATLVIPGLSGALILLVMGLYPLLVHSISSVALYAANPGNLGLLAEIAAVLLPYGIGALAGCLGMARVMEKLMRGFYRQVHAAILGLVLGSVAVLLIDPLAAFTGGGIGAVTAAAGLAAFAGGFAAAAVVGRRGGTIG